MDIKFSEIYDGENFRNNDGTHLDENTHYKLWQSRYKKIISHPLCHYDLPNCSIGKHCIRLLMTNLMGCSKGNGMWKKHALQQECCRLHLKSRALLNLGAELSESNMMRKWCVIMTMKEKKCSRI